MDINRQTLVDALAALREQMPDDKHARGCKAAHGKDFACSLWCAKARASIADLRRVLFSKTAVR